MPKRKQNFPETETLFVRAVTVAQSVSLDELKMKTGLPESWLSKFRNRKIFNPSVNRIETILRAFELL